MSASKKLKRTLFASSLSVILIVVLFFSSTLAWYMDSGVYVNTFTMGILSMDVVKGTPGTPGETSISGKNVGIMSVTSEETVDPTQYLFEPGVIWALPTMYVHNTGDVPLNFKLRIDLSSVTHAGVNLLDAVDFYVYVGSSVPTDRSGALSAHTPAELADLSWRLAAGEYSLPIVIYMHMRESAGNEYMNAYAENIGITFVGYQDGMSASDIADLYSGG